MRTHLWANVAGVLSLGFAFLQTTAQEMPLIAFCFSLSCGYTMVVDLKCNRKTKFNEALIIEITMGQKKEKCS